MVKLYQLVGVHPIATVSVMSYMGESPRQCRRHPGEVSRLAQVSSAFPHTAVRIIGMSELSAI